ncbi:hypothetical protein UlMin_038549 [Ulmus minor]
MSFLGESSHIPTGNPGNLDRKDPFGSSDPPVDPLTNLLEVQTKMDSLNLFLSKLVNANAPITQDQSEMVSSEIASAIEQIVVNGTALLAFSQTIESDFESTDRMDHNRLADVKIDSLDKEVKKEEGEDTGDGDGDFEILELDAVELLAEHIHICEICGKGFKRDANLRMHMRAHGNRFKTPEALIKPGKGAEPNRRTRFSCPQIGCNRNRAHKKFRALKSAICAKNHFKRSHCPKMYSCNRCNKKCFSVLADLKSHLKNCGEARWRCGCGTSFSRKDKLFGHMALFEGHMPAVVDDQEEKNNKLVNSAMEEDSEEEDYLIFKDEDLDGNCEESELFQGLLDGFGSIEEFSWQDVLGFPGGSGLC